MFANESGLSTFERESLRNPLRWRLPDSLRYTKKPTTLINTTVPIVRTTIRPTGAEDFEGLGLGEGPRSSGGAGDPVEEPSGGGGDVGVG